MSPRTIRRINWDLWIGGAIMVTLALLLIYVYVHANVRMIGHDSVTVVASDPSPEDRTLMRHMAESMRKWNR
jgi:hypothetical protein